MSGDDFLDLSDVVIDLRHLGCDEIEAVVQAGLVLVEGMRLLGDAFVCPLAVLMELRKAFIDMLADRGELFVKELLDCWDFICVCHLEGLSHVGEDTRQDGIFLR